MAAHFDVFIFPADDDDDSDEDDEAGEGNGQEKVSPNLDLCVLCTCSNCVSPFRRRKWGIYSWHGRCWRLLK